MTKKNRSLHERRLYVRKTMLERSGKQHEYHRGGQQREIARQVGKIVLDMSFYVETLAEADGAAVPHIYEMTPQDIRDIVRAFSDLPLGIAAWVYYLSRNRVLAYEGLRVFWNFNAAMSLYTGAAGVGSGMADSDAVTYDAFMRNMAEYLGMKDRGETVQAYKPFAAAFAQGRGTEKLKATPPPFFPDEDSQEQQMFDELKAIGFSLKKAINRVAEGLDYNKETTKQALVIESLRAAVQAQESQIVELEKRYAGLSSRITSLEMKNFDPFKHPLNPFKHPLNPCPPKIGDIRFGAASQEKGE